MGLPPLKLVRCFSSCVCGLLTSRCKLLVHAACLGMLFPSPFPLTVRGPGLLTVTGWSSSGPCSLLVPSLELGTIPTVPAPHLTLLGLYTQVLLLVPSWLPAPSLLHLLQHLHVGQSFPRLAVTFPTRTLEELLELGEQWWQLYCVDQGSPPLAHTSWGKNPLLEKTFGVRS